METKQISERTDSQFLAPAYPVKSNAEEFAALMQQLLSGTPMQGELWDGLLSSLTTPKPELPVEQKLPARPVEERDEREEEPDSVDERDEDDRDAERADTQMTDGPVVVAVDGGASGQPAAQVREASEQPVAEEYKDQAPQAVQSFRQPRADVEQESQSFAQGQSGANAKQTAAPAPSGAAEIGEAPEDTSAAKPMAAGEIPQKRPLDASSRSQTAQVQVGEQGSDEASPQVTQTVTQSTVSQGTQSGTAPAQASSASGAVAIDARTAPTSSSALQARGAEGASPALRATSGAELVTGAPGGQAAAERGSQVKAKAQAQGSRALEHQKVIEQVREALKKAAVARDQQSVTVRLDPEELGALSVKVTARDGVVSARITPESPEVEKVLREHAPKITEALAAAGFRADQIQLSIGRERTASETLQFVSAQPPGNSAQGEAQGRSDGREQGGRSLPRWLPEGAEAAGLERIQQPSNAATGWVA